MINRWLTKLFSFAFISTCLCVGVGIGSAIRIGKIQALDKPPRPVDTLPILPPATEEQSFPDSITVQAVGDFISSTNYPDHKLPRSSNQLISIRYEHK